MGQWLIDIGADKGLGVIVIVLGLYFGIRMFFISKDPKESSVIGKRARDAKGHYIADDKSTPENEAYYGGKPSLQPKTKRKYLKTKDKTS